MRNAAIILTDKFTSHPRSTLNLESCVEEKTSNIHSCFMLSSENTKTMSRYLKLKYSDLLSLYNSFSGKKIVYIFMGYSESLNNFSESEFTAHYKSILKLLTKIGFEVCVCSYNFIGKGSSLSQDRFIEYMNKQFQTGYLKGYNELRLNLKPSVDKSLTKMSVVVNSKFIARDFDSKYTPEVVIKVYKTLDEHNLQTGRPIKKVKTNSMINIDVGVFE